MGGWVDVAMRRILKGRRSIGRVCEGTLCFSAVSHTAAVTNSLLAYSMWIVYMEMNFCILRKSYLYGFSPRHYG